MPSLKRVFVLLLASYVAINGFLPKHLYYELNMNPRVSCREGVWHTNHISALAMVSVSGGSSMSPKPLGPIISPRLNSWEAERLIIDNFNQIQQGEQKKIGIIGTQELSLKHRQMIELLSYALLLSGNHVFTSGGGNGTNIAVIKGALRACRSDLLTVILPQSLSKQPVEMQPIFLRVANLIDNPQYDSLDLKEAAVICNEKIISMVDEVLVFAYHHSYTILNSVDKIPEDSKMVTKFFLD